MKVSEFYTQDKPVFSFEFFPPKTPEASEKLFETIKALKTLEPSYVTCTYGAMGSTRTNTFEIIEKIKKDFQLEVASHLTCIAHDKKQMEELLYELKEKEVENIVALRGDAPQDGSEPEKIENGFQYANELVSFIRQHPDFKDYFCLIVAGYPEGHIECSDLTTDLNNLKIKMDAGSDIITTQLFFDNNDFYAFEEKVRALGITQPIIPGLIPVTNGKQIQRFAKMCGSKIPKNLQDKLDEYGDDNDSIEKFGIDFAAKQCQDLLAHGVPGIHFYTLNKEKPITEIYKKAGLK